MSGNLFSPEELKALEVARQQFLKERKEKERQERRRENIIAGFVIAAVAIAGVAFSKLPPPKTYPPSSWVGTVVDGRCEPSVLGSGDHYYVTLRNEEGQKKNVAYAWPTATQMCYQRSMTPNIGDQWTITNNEYVDPNQVAFGEGQVKIDIRPVASVKTSSAAQLDR